MNKKYRLPPFLENLQDQAAYERWLQRKAIAHMRRDRNELVAFCRRVVSHAEKVL